jgi:hypothetical protein
MSVKSFKVFSIEMYAEKYGISSDAAYKTFKESGLLDEIENDYEDLHGMSWQWLNDYYHKFISAQKAKKKEPK